MLAWMLIAVLILSLIFLRRGIFTRKGPVTIGFFHPYCHAGGGGERVLWVAVSSLQRWATQRGVDISIVIFTGDSDSDQAILRRAVERFGVTFPVEQRLRFVRIQTRWMLEARYYPRFTLLGQSIGSIFTGLECILRAGVHVWVDTTGAAFTYPVAHYLGGARVVAYVHYPTVSTDMLATVSSNVVSFNNSAVIASSPLLTRVKVAYYRAFARAYGAAGRCAAPSGVMANSRWTAAHIRELWGGDVSIVYPPCPTEALASLPMVPRDRTIVSLAQFRPEKDHAVQLRAFAELRSRGRGAYDDVRLEIMGGVRDAGDAERLQALREMAKALCIPSSRLTFTPNPPFEYVKLALGRARVGLHTMPREHFGIVCVEMQAAGCVLLAHDSGGPKEDIAVPAWRPVAGVPAFPSRQSSSSSSSSKKGRGGTTSVLGLEGQRPTGLLASTVEGYADALEAVFSGALDASALAAAGRESAGRFSDSAFTEGFLSVLGPIVESCCPHSPVTSTAHPTGLGRKATSQKSTPRRREASPSSSHKKRINK